MTVYPPKNSIDRQLTLSQFVNTSMSFSRFASVELLETAAIFFLL